MHFEKELNLRIGFSSRANYKQYFGHMKRRVNNNQCRKMEGKDQKYFGPDFMN